MKNAYSYIKYISLTLALFACLNSYGQAIAELKSGLTHYQRNHVTEKLFVHVNKDFFVTGDVIWFKIYCVNGATNEPMDMSKVAYVELLDSQNQPVVQTKVGLKNAEGHGSVFLPANISGGNYTLRAYTNWMKNFGAESFFEQQIKIFSLLQWQPVPQTKTVDDYDVQFMPEGGNLVCGLPGRAAVKVTGTNGLGVNYTGAIVDERNDTLTRFSSFKFGMTSFGFTPVSGRSYTSVLKINGITIKKPVPYIVQNGYTLHAEDTDDTWDISVNSTEAIPLNTYLIIHNPATVVAAVELKGAERYSINKKNLPDGISTVTLFNAQRQPVCERLIFKHPQKELKLSAGTDVPVYEQRRKVKIKISGSVPNNSVKPVSLSVSVYKTDDALQPAGELNINSYLWLSSEIKGQIESPGYYLKGTPESDKALNDLLLTQGWRIFNWSEANTTAKYRFSYLPEYSGLLFNGRILNKQTGSPVANTLAYLSVPDTVTQKLFTAVSDANGLLKFNLGYQYGNHDVIIQANHFIDSTDYRFEEIDPYSTLYSKTKASRFAWNVNNAPLLDEYGLSVQVQNTYNISNFRFFEKPFADTSAFFGVSRKSFLLSNYTRFSTIEEVLTEFVTYSEVFRRNGKPYVRMRFDNGFMANDPLVLIDGVPLFNNNKLFAIDPLRIKAIDVLNKKYLHGPAQYDGLLMLTSNNADMGGLILDPKSVVIDYSGLQQQRQFYSPKYENADEQTSRVPDYRMALYWNPEITTTTNSDTELSFYTSDVSGSYYGLIQGITNEGDTGWGEFRFQVK